MLATVTQPGVLHISAVRPAPALPKSLRAGQPGSSPKVTTVAGRGGVIVTASGAMAQGLAAEQVSAGQPTAQCGAPGTSSWFMGPGQATAGNIEIYLINTDSAAGQRAGHGLTDITKGGPLLANADNGITVPPHSMVTQSLTGLVQSSKVLALWVSTSVGRVVAAVRESKTGTDSGSWLPVSQAPARSLVIAGIPHTSGSPKLFIAVPGSGTAAIKVTAVTLRGSYQPTGGTNIDLIGADGVPGLVALARRGRRRAQAHLQRAHRRRGRAARRPGRRAGRDGRDRGPGAGAGRAGGQPGRPGRDGASGPVRAGQGRDRAHRRRHRRHRRER